MQCAVCTPHLNMWSMIKSFVEHHTKWHLIFIFTLLTFFTIDLVYEGNTPHAKWHMVDKVGKPFATTDILEMTMHYHKSSIVIGADPDAGNPDDPLYTDRPITFKPKDLRQRNITQAFYSSPRNGRDITRFADNHENWSKACDNAFEFTGTAYYIVMVVFLVITATSSVTMCGANSQQSRGIMMGAYFIAMATFAFTRVGMMTHLLDQHNCHISALTEHYMAPFAADQNMDMVVASRNKDQMLTDVQYTGIIFAIVALLAGCLNIASAAVAETGSTMTTAFSGVRMNVF